MPSYPEKLQTIIELFETLPDVEKRENLIAYAESASKWQPQEEQAYDLEDVRKDEECTDTVGIYLNVDPDTGGVHFRVMLGPEVQTLTRAMTTILCRGLDGAQPEEILDVPQDFVPKIVGQELVRVRSQTVYYVLGRMKTAVKSYLDRKRARVAG